MSYRFVWDENKRLLNLKKHHIDFELAAEVFAGVVITFEDTRKDYGEKRYISIGTLYGRHIVIVRTQNEDIIRIISMRKANEREKKIYYKYIEKN